jgi:uncharacterized SAM-binding protein YcdF (DUF218 family)
MNPEIISNAKVLWDFMKLDQPLRKVDCLLVMGSHDLRVAEYGARLFLDGWAPFMICSGGLGNLTRSQWHEAEAVKFARVARKMGVPHERILVEDKSTNTGENVTFTKLMLESKDLHPQSFILVHKPYMERRALATFQKLWPERQAIVTSPPQAFEEYPTKTISRHRMINIMVGDFQRLQNYPEKGFQISQPIPDKVLLAFQRLVRAGYTQHLIH